ncbi:MAG: mannitol dehydrogenase family protein [Rhizobiales bacterium]|nr:mannitol dehydrogenase family protein [Hyphomicrobiales bacterium]
MRTPIVQFGTSRFLQAHADLFISDAMRAGQPVGPVTVVQTSGSADRAGRLAAFDGRPLPIVIRGLEDGRAVERTEETTCLVRGLSSATDWAEISRIFTEEAEQVISNTGDGGYRMPEGETIGAGVPESFPAKLTKLLHARWQAGGAPLTLFPTELVPNNGAVLRGHVLAVAARSGLGEDFMAWVETACIFASSLVDRIVSSPLEPAGAVAEPYALWAIERQPGLVVPWRHPAVVLVDDLAVTERLKLFLLNLAHTCMADRWKGEGRRADETVRELVADPEIRAWLDALYDEELLPVFAAAGIDEAPGYRRSVIDRFRNPYLDHRLSDIIMNHADKKQRRVGGFIAWAGAVAPDLPLRRLRAVAESGVA